MTIGSITIVLQDLALGGTERIAVRLARRWADLGYDVRLFCGDQAGPLGALLGERVRIVTPGSSIPRKAGSVRRLAEAAATYLAAEPSDVLFVPGNYHWRVVAKAAALPARQRPVIVAQVSAALRKPQRNRPRQIVYDLRMRRLLHKADGLVTLSDSAKGQATGIVPGPIVRTIASPALDDDLPPPSLAVGRTVIGAGRLVPEKGFATLIEAVARIDDPTVTLVIVGDGPEAERLHALGAALGLSERLQMPGYQRDIRPWLDQARLFVLSSHFEGYPAVMIEAFAAGRPVVATDCTPATDTLLTDPAFGQVVPIGDVPAMADAIRAMLDQPPPPPDRLAAMVAPHRLSEAAGRYLAFFEELRERRG